MSPIRVVVASLSFMGDGGGEVVYGIPQVTLEHAGRWVEASGIVLLLLPPVVFVPPLVGLLCPT
eukprot:9107174-Heterocapsa_arctica.AAC.1